GGATRADRRGHRGRRAGRDDDDARPRRPGPVVCPLSQAMGSMAVTPVDPLDNPVWSSISAAHADLADVVTVGSGRAGRYQRDVAPFGAVEDAANPACWDALGEVLEGHATCLLVDPADVPAGWEVMRVIDGVQMDGTA